MKPVLALAALAAAFTIGDASASFVTTIPSLPPTTGTQPWADGVYRTADQVHAEFPGLTVDVAWHTEFREIQRHPSQTNPADEVETFLSTVIAYVTPTGGPTTPVIFPAPVTTEVFGKTGNVTGTFQTEMLSMDLQIPPMPGLPPVSLRESPTLASTGQTSITDIGGGLYAIDSFFDIFLEISYDGGQSWLPQLPSASTGQAFTHVVLQDASPVPVPAAAWLFGSGLAGLFAWGRRKAS